MKKTLLWTASFIAVVIIFHICYGLKTLNPANISWLMTVMHDWGQHYLGWRFYKDEDWQFPLGHISNLYYPVGTNVGFTDSIPLLAIFFKIFKPILPQEFQYFGMWLFLCHLLAAYYTIKLLKLFKVNDLCTFIAVIFIAANPVLLYRGMHPALCAQWLIIASVYLYFLSPATTKSSRILLYQFILLMIAVLVNPYIGFMIVGCMLATASKICFFDKAITKKYFFGYVAGSMLSILLAWYLVGLITFGGKEDLGVQGAYGLYSLNLNSLYNGVGWSTLFKPFKQVSWHQYEGFMYLGAGMFALMLILLVLYIRNRIKKTASPMKFTLQQTSLVPLLILTILFSLFSVTHIVSLDAHVLFTVPVPKQIKQLGEIFRASARFFWLPYYLILLFTIIGISRLKIKPAAILTILFAGLLLQLYDTKLLLTHRKMTSGSYETPLDNKSWTNLMNQFDEIAFYPPFASHQLTNMDYQYFCFLAAQTKKPINIGYVARADARAMASYSDSLTKLIEEGRLSPQTLYITTSPHLEHFALAYQSGGAKLNTLDGYYYIYSTGLRNSQLDQQTNALNEKNKSKLDTALDILSKKISFLETGKIAQSTDKPVRFFIQRINSGEKYVSIDGWAFIDQSQNNKGDSIFITLTSADKSYIAPSTIIPRPDVTSYFKKTYLEDAGFKSLAFLDNVEPGRYQLGLAIKNAAGVFFYQPTEHTVKAGLPPSAKPVSITTLPAAGKISYGLDHVTSDGDLIKVSGWAAFENRDAENCTISCLLQSADNTYIFETESTKRPDVTAYFKNKFKLDNSGFVVSISKSLLNKGKYKLAVVIKDLSNNQQNLIFTDKEIDVR